MYEIAIQRGQNHWSRDDRTSRKDDGTKSRSNLKDETDLEDSAGGETYPRKRFRPNDPSSCVPCKWRRRSCHPCDGSPCDACADAMARYNKRWECYYDPDFLRPDEYALPDIYRAPIPNARPASDQHRDSSPTTAIKRRRVMEPEISAVISDDKIDTPPSRHVRTSSISQPEPLEENTSLPQPTAETVPQPVMNTQPAATGSTDKYTSVHALVASIKADIESISEIASLSESNEFPKQAAEKWVLDLAQNLKHPELVSSLDAEEKIESSKLPDSIKLELLKANLEGCLAEINWRENLVE